ncbi:MAG TPA: methylmalonyl Co-A mutase-associated GTPase MeaB, partial [Acidimicrobiales bacterium]|nr:methylmalonyl Co-A mutase-associated GTPase MeaB [Acidimicrobiales bacterium]
PVSAPAGPLAGPGRRPADPVALLDAATTGDRVALARLVSYIERGGATATAVARLAYRAEVPYTVGLTGAPGAGKSTLTDRLISEARGGWPEPVSRSVPQVGVLAVDPTSPFSGGAILGDRVRMSQHALDPAVYIRSMATRGHLGGLSLAVPDAVRLLGATGIDVVIVETVGVGQMEVEIASAADTTVVVVTPGWGDAMQANKAGLLEVADVFVINKADRPGRREARRDLEQMLDLARPESWRPEIVDTTATAGEGVDHLWSAVARHRAHLETTGELAGRRARRLAQGLRRVLLARAEGRVDELVSGEGFAVAVKALAAGELDPYTAADRILG